MIFVIIIYYGRFDEIVFREKERYNDPNNFLINEHKVLKITIKLRISIAIC